MLSRLISRRLNLMIGFNSVFGFNSVWPFIAPIGTNLSSDFHPPASLPPSPTPMVKSDTSSPPFSEILFDRQSHDFLDNNQYGVDDWMFIISDGSIHPHGDPCSSSAPMPANQMLQGSRRQDSEDSLGPDCFGMSNPASIIFICCCCRYCCFSSSSSPSSSPLLILLILPQFNYLNFKDSFKASRRRIP